MGIKLKYFEQMARTSSYIEQEKFCLSSFRHQFPILEEPVNGCRLHYLDNAATTQVPQRVLSALYQYEATARSNVKRGVHQLASRSTDAYEGAREIVARYLNAQSHEEVVFTSGTTASVNLLAFSLGSTFEAGDEIVISQSEHHSNYIPWMMLGERQGVIIKIAPVDGDGRIDMEALERLVSPRCRLIALTHASNVTGAVTDVISVVKIARHSGALVFLDGAQAAAHGPLDLQELDVDFYAFSGHKCYGPTGVGVLWGRQGLLKDLPPFLGGGGMVQRVCDTHTDYAEGYRRFEAGTPPIAQAVGLGEALQWLMEQPWETLRQRERKLTGLLLSMLKSIPGLRLLGPGNLDQRLPLVSFDIAGVHPHDLCYLLDQQGVALRGGSHCAQPLMQSFGVSASSRVSLALYNDEDDIEALSVALKSAVKILQ